MGKREITLEDNRLLKLLQYVYTNIRMIDCVSASIAASRLGVEVGISNFLMTKSAIIKSVEPGKYEWNLRVVPNVEMARALRKSYAESLLPQRKSKPTAKRKSAIDDMAKMRIFVKYVKTETSDWAKCTGLGIVSFLETLGLPVNTMSAMVKMNIVFTTGALKGTMYKWNPTLQVDDEMLSEIQQQCVRLAKTGCVLKKYSDKNEVVSQACSSDQPKQPVSSSRGKSLDEKLRLMLGYLYNKTKDGYVCAKDIRMTNYLRENSIADSYYTVMLKMNVVVKKPGLSRGSAQYRWNGKLACDDKLLRTIREQQKIYLESDRTVINQVYPIYPVASPSMALPDNGAPMHKPDPLCSESAFEKIKAFIQYMHDKTCNGYVSAMEVGAKERMRKPHIDDRIYTVMRKMNVILDNGSFGRGIMIKWNSNVPMDYHLVLEVIRQKNEYDTSGNKCVTRIYSIPPEHGSVSDVSMPLSQSIPLAPAELEQADEKECPDTLENKVWNWTDEELWTIKQGFFEKLSSKEIAEIMGVGEYAVCVVIDKMKYHWFDEMNNIHAEIGRQREMLQDEPKPEPAPEPAEENKKRGSFSKFIKSIFGKHE